MIILLMGVTGSGKTTIGKLLAKGFSCEFLDADDYHSPDNKAKMKAGIALTDSDRQPWLEDLAKLINKHAIAQRSLVLACSALKDSYREILSEAYPYLVIVYLKIAPDTAADRLANRQHEFMNADLLDSQFKTLEEPTGDNVIVIDAGDKPQAIVNTIMSQFEGQRQPG